MRTRSLSRAAVLAFALLAAACGMLSNENKGPPCPEVSILKDAASITQFGPGSSRDITNVEVAAEVVAARGTCIYQRKKGRITVEFNVTIEAVRGPADDDRSAVVPYFVAVAQWDGTILSKNSFEAGFVFPPNRNRVRLRDDEIALTIPVSEGQGGTDFEIFLGFQLTSEEVEYNRRTETRL